MLIYLLLMIFMSLVGFIVFSMKYKHLLIMLLSLEFIVISIYFNMMIYFMSYFYEYFFLMIFLTMSVCEGALGLSVLVSMIRVYGNDYIMSFSSLW